MIKHLAAAAISAAAAASLLAAPSVSAGERPKGEEKLAKMLEGREAGEPQRCIRTLGSDNLTIIDGTAIVYKRGDTVWVNRTQKPENLDDDDVLVIRKFSASQLCRLDQITTQDRFAGFYTGNVFLTDFVPYEKKGG